MGNVVCIMGKNLTILLRKLFFLLPFCIVKRYFNHRRMSTSILNYLDLEEVKQRKNVIDKPIFDTIVSVQGFGYSGSGAVCDLLREIRDVSVIGYRDSNNNNSDINPILSCEVDFVRVAGGICEIEKLIGSTNHFINDALIKRFIDNTDDFFYRFESCPIKLKIEFARFINQIVDFKIQNLDYDFYNPHLNMSGFSEFSKKNIYFLKKISVEDYRKLVNSLLTSFFNIFPRSKMLVLDQFFADSENDIEKKNAYVNGIRIINVQRDPRDVFCFGKSKKIKWIPSDVNIFIKWYRANLDNVLSCSNIQVMNLCFEDLVCDYENTVKKIFHFLYIDNQNHIHAKKYFDPKNSVKNVSLWKMFEYDSNIRQIENELSEYCYNKI